MNRGRFFLSALFFSIGASIFVYRELSLRQADRGVSLAKKRQLSSAPALSDDLGEMALNRYALKREGENYSMRFYMEKTLSCDLGDFEAIAGSLERTNDKNLLLSVESISVEDGFSPITMEIGRAEFANGFSRTLELPGNIGPRQLGLFLCTDSQKAGRCAVKPVVQINEVLRENLRQEKEAHPAEAPDRIYYFQYLFVDAEGALHLFRQSPLSKQSLELMSGRFGKIFPVESVETERMSLAKAALFSRTLTSTPLTLKTEGFAVTLPGRDKERCASPVAEALEKRK